jgi:hypothetical protein
MLELRPAPPHRHEGKYRAAMSFSDSYLGRLRKRIGNAGVTVAEDDLIPFGCLSEAETHTIIYPNGDIASPFIRTSVMPTSHRNRALGAGIGRLRSA